MHARRPLVAATLVAKPAGDLDEILATVAELAEEADTPGSRAR